VGFEDEEDGSFFMIWSDFVQVSCSQVKPHRPVEAQAGFNPLCLSQRAWRRRRPTASPGVACGQGSAGRHPSLPAGMDCPFLPAVCLTPACASKVQTGLYLCVCHINALSGQNLTDTRVCLHALARPSRTSTVVRGSGGLRPDLAVHLH